MKAQPFLKWVGGKRQLLNQLSQYLPDPMPSKYAELFLGGGAMFWELSQRFEFEEIVLNDINTTLIDCYKLIQQNNETFYRWLREFQDSYDVCDLNHKSAVLVRLWFKTQVARLWFKTKKTFCLMKSLTNFSISKDTRFL